MKGVLGCVSRSTVEATRPYSKAPSRQPSSVKTALRIQSLSFKDEEIKALSLKDREKLMLFKDKEINQRLSKINSFSFKKESIHLIQR